MSVQDASALWPHWVETLVRSGVRRVFGMVGDGDSLLEAAHRHGQLRVVTARDQRVAIGMALGHAQVTGEPSVYVASPGPGLVNAMTGILEAWSAATPLVIISEGIPRRQRGEGAFQEVDALSLLQPIAKWCYRIEDGEKADWALHRAFHLAVNGKPGPTFIEVPRDVSVVDRADHPAPLPLTPLNWQADPGLVGEAAAVLGAARRPLIVAGGGCRGPATGELLTRLAELLPAALFTTASGRGVIDERHDLACGVAGLYATPPADDLLREADVYLAVGTQLEETATTGWLEAARDQTVIHIDRDLSSLRRVVIADYCLVGDAGLTMHALVQSVSGGGRQGGADDGSWSRRIRAVRRDLHGTWGRTSFLQSPVRATFRAIGCHFGEDVMLVQDNGLHDMWGYFYPIYAVIPPGRTVVPGEQTGLGLAMGAAVGAACAAPGMKTVAVVGDGSFQMASSAVLTAAELGLGITYIVINNGGFSWPRLQQSYRDLEVGAAFGIEIDFWGLTRTVGGYFAQPRSDDELASALEAARSANTAGRVALVEIRVDWKHDIPVGVQLHYGGGEGDP